MKSSRFYPKHAILSLLTLGLMATTSVQAQSDQKASASPFEAVMYPSNRSSPAINVNFDNLSGGSVRIVIRDQNGKVHYDEHESTSHYRRRFNLASMPSGEYTVELSKRNKHQTQTFVIDAPVERHIALKSDPTQDSDKNVAVKQ